MSLKIYSSNHVERLQAMLSSVLSKHPLVNPFSPETIITPTYALSRWLNLRLAQDLGIAANINYLRPSQWFWELVKSNLPELSVNDNFSRQQLGWHIYHCLQSLPHQAVFDPVRAYCESDDSGIKRWQLAERLADSFDRYQWYRPEMIEDWSRGKDNQWQAALWRLLLDQLGSQHRPYQVKALINELGNLPRGIDTLERISLFTLSELPPLYLSVIHALARHCHLDLYLHSPTDQYWADLKSQKSLGQKRLQAPESAHLFETGNELLSAWGRQGQVFQDLLLNADIVDSLDIELYRQPATGSLLEKIQASVFAINQPRQKATIDDSVQVHACHSAMRECQVLQDHLLDFLNRDDQLQPEDILVMVPDISAYAASIETVFKFQNTHGLGCNLSDLSLANEHPSAVSFLQLLALPESRFTRSDILALLDNPTIRHRFGIDASGHQGIIDFINTSRVKWGINGQHKTGFGIPATIENTWQQARDRFYAGYAFSGVDLWQDIAPLATNDNHASRQLGRFWHFFDQLCQWRHQLAGERSAAEWRLLLNELLTVFFGDPDALANSIQLIRDGIDQCLPEGDMTLSPALLSQLLEKQLYHVEQTGQLYSGGITFCGLRPMRNIPFKVICLLGMNHNAFPRSDKPAEFDLMALKPRGGDPSYRLQDRYLMLETLLCCRQKLYISYTGHSLQDNSQLPPSTLVDDLLDYISNQFVDPEGGDVSQSICHSHSMQAWSRRQFSDDGFSFHKAWFEIGQQLASPAGITPYHWPGSRVVEIGPESVINVEDLRRFLQHPVRYFINETLGVRLVSEETESDEETFELDGLQRWQLRQQLAHNHLRQIDNSLSIMQAQGRLPHGAAARSNLDELSVDSENWLFQLNDFQGRQKQSLLVDLELNPTLRIHGRVSDYYDGLGLMTICPGRLKGRQLLLAWLDHLLLCAGNQLPASENTRIIATDQQRQFNILDPRDACEHLLQYSKVFFEGRQRPLPVFPDTSFEWAQQSDREKARKKAWGKWENQFNPAYPGDRNDPYIALVLRDEGHPPFDEVEFDQLATMLYNPVLTHGLSDG